MAFLNGIFSGRPPRLARLRSGSFTVDAEGHVVSYTLPQSFPESHMAEIGREVLAYFRGAAKARVRIRELIVTYPALRLSARELRGGAIVFLAPQAYNRS